MGSATSSHQDGSHHVHRHTDSGWCGVHSYSRGRGYRPGRPGSVSLDDDDFSPGDECLSARSSSSDSKGSCSQCSCSDCSTPPTPRPRPSHSSPPGRSHTPSRAAGTDLADGDKQGTVTRDPWLPGGSVDRPQAPRSHPPDTGQRRHTLRGDSLRCSLQSQHAASKTYGSVALDRQYDSPGGAPKAHSDAKGFYTHGRSTRTMAGGPQGSRNPRPRRPQTLPSSTTHTKKHRRSRYNVEERNTSDLGRVGRHQPEHVGEVDHFRCKSRDLSRNMTEPRHSHPRQLVYYNRTHPWGHNLSKCFWLGWRPLTSRPPYIAYYFLYFLTARII